MENIYFTQTTRDNFSEIYSLAEKIWLDTYSTILSKEQINYMLPLMYSAEKIQSEIAQGYLWEMLYINTQCVGYLDYKLMEDQRVFLSKIYLDKANLTKGLGRLMLERVLSFALDNKATAVYLTVNINNSKAISFYERNGFKKIDTKTVAIGQGYVMDDYIYQFNL